MRDLVIKKISVSIAIAIFLSSCSGNSNIKSEWDCPKQQGQGCITIEKADHIAMQKLAIKESQLQEKPPIMQEGEEREVWFMPYTDNFGNFHEASVIKYRG